MQIARLIDYLRRRRIPRPFYVLVVFRFLGLLANAFKVAKATLVSDSRLVPVEHQIQSNHLLTRKARHERGDWPDYASLSRMGSDENFGRKCVAGIICLFRSHICFRDLINIFRLFVPATNFPELRIPLEVN